VSFNYVTKDAAFYTTTSHIVSWMVSFSQTRQELWLSKDDLRDSSSWSSSPLILPRDIHSKLIDQYDFKEVCAPSPSQINAGASAKLSSQDGVPQQEETGFFKNVFRFSHSRGGCTFRANTVVQMISHTL
jgi:hypothetical protein